MFRSTRRKIVVAIMSILVLLLGGTLGVIYTCSYFEMKKQDERMLQVHAERFTLSPSSEQTLPQSRPNREAKPDFDRDSPKFQLSNFYTVAVSYDGDVLEIRNEPPTIYSNEDLEEMAKGVIAEDERTGREKDLTFLKMDKGEYILVTFMDNTVVNEGAQTLLRYTLLFGGVALILFFFVSVFLAGKIVRPLEESYQKQKQFISDAGHELKTPVSVIGVNAELLSREIGENQWLENIQYENERMGILVGQLLDLARTENVTPQMEHIDLSRLVAGEVLPFESVAYEKGLTLSSNIAGGISVEGNSTQLKQLTSILLDNAIRHSKARGEVCLRLTKEHGNVVLSVVNPGNEIPMEHRERIFERFYRMDSARNGEDQHYGLGLAIAKAIATAHNGNIQVLCYNGLVEFRVELPTAR